MKDIAGFYRLCSNDIESHSHKIISPKPTTSRTFENEHFFLENEMCLILTISMPVTVLPRTLDRAAGDHFTDHGMFTSKMMQKNSAMRGLIIIWRYELGCDRSNIISVTRIAGSLGYIIIYLVPVTRSTHWQTSESRLPVPVSAGAVTVASTVTPSCTLP
jgi:hypothetical protein